jgi:hypothetical protein
MVTKHKAEMGPERQQQQHRARHVHPQGNLCRQRRRANRIGQIPEAEQPDAA